MLGSAFISNLLDGYNRDGVYTNKKDTNISMTFGMPGSIASAGRQIARVYQEHGTFVKVSKKLEKACHVLGKILLTDYYPLQYVAQKNNYRPATNVPNIVAAVVHLMGVSRLNMIFKNVHGKYLFPGKEGTVWGIPKGSKWSKERFTSNREMPLVFPRGISRIGKKARLDAYRNSTDVKIMVLSPKDAEDIEKVADEEEKKRLIGTNIYTLDEFIQKRVVNGTKEFWENHKEFIEFAFKKRWNNETDFYHAVEYPRETVSASFNHNIEECCGYFGIKLEKDEEGQLKKNKDNQVETKDEEKKRDIPWKKGKKRKVEKPDDKNRKKNKIYDRKLDFSDVFGKFNAYDQTYLDTHFLDNFQKGLMEGDKKLTGEEEKDKETIMDCGRKALQKAAIGLFHAQMTKTIAIGAMTESLLHEGMYSDDLNSLGTGLSRVMLDTQMFREFHRGEPEKPLTLPEEMSSTVLQMLNALYETCKVDTEKKLGPENPEADNAYTKSNREIKLADKFLRKTVGMNGKPESMKEEASDTEQAWMSLINRDNREIGEERLSLLEDNWNEFPNLETIEEKKVPRYRQDIIKFGKEILEKKEEKNDDENEESEDDEEGSGEE